MNARQQYECEVISTFAKRFNEAYPPKPVPSLSDEDYDAENEAQALFYEALGEFVAKVEKAKARTEIRSKALDEFIDDVKRSAPNPIAWSEDINAKRRGWE